MARRIVAPKVSASAAFAARPSAKEENMKCKEDLARARVIRLTQHDGDCVTLLKMLGLDGAGVGRVENEPITELT